jgi:hypothetical protein
VSSAGSECPRKFYNKPNFCFFANDLIARGDALRTEPLSSVQEFEMLCSYHTEGLGPYQLRRLVVGFPPRRPGLEPRSGHVRFVVDEVALGQVFSECFGFPWQFSFYRLLHSHHLSSGAGYNWPVIGRRTKLTQSHPTPPQETKRKMRGFGSRYWSHSLRKELHRVFFCKYNMPTNVFENIFIRENEVLIHP